jgi:hypothetical protein
VLNCEENWDGGLSFGLFLKEFGGGGTWRWRRGGTLCVNLDFWGNLIVSMGLGLAMAYLPYITHIKW